MSKIKFQRKGAFGSAMEEEGHKAEAAEQEIEKKIANNEIEEIDLLSIENPTKHDRVGYSELAINEMAESFKGPVGQLQPIVVRKITNKRYERIIGFRRILAAKAAGWSTIKAVVLKNIDDDVAALMMLSENMHREDPNLYDQTIKLLEYVALSLQVPEEDVIKFLYRLKNYESGIVTSLEEEEKDLRDEIEAILERTAKITIITLVDRLRVLRLNDRLIRAMRENNLIYSHAIELNKIKDHPELEATIAKVLQEKPSKKELKAMIKALSGEQKKEGREDKYATLADAIKKDISVAKLKSLGDADYMEVEKHYSAIHDILSKT